MICRKEYTMFRNKKSEEEPVRMVRLCNVATDMTFLGFLKKLTKILKTNILYDII